eukprot:TRINITY_DN383_c0_g1_i1.p1 TRINITY_DN383_c0_g1~~TRINITY_DN383_c0_g1_i1.p1  ORF type:complete len:229 (-),score=26.09 TRINITY_DN383_c0_g1_i1:28-714(-)
MDNLTREQVLKEREQLLRLPQLFSYQDILEGGVVIPPNEDFGNITWPISTSDSFLFRSPKQLRDKVRSHRITTSMHNKLYPRSSVAYLEIHAMSASVISRDLDGFSDPYIMIYCGKTKIWKCEKIKNTLNPSWEFHHPVSLSLSLWNEYNIIIMDYDPVGRHDYLGSVIFTPGILKDMYELSNRSKITVRYSDLDKYMDNLEDDGYTFDAEIKGNFSIEFSFREEQLI